jgi:Ser/Thr protein kinase RdoA (MazF antagonist)
MSNITQNDIRRAVQTAGLEKYGGTYSELGGGEINDTFLLDCGTQKVVLRIARYEDQKSLAAEAATLSLLNLPGVPKLIFFDESQRIKDKLWIAESFMKGGHVSRLDVSQFESLGALLARIHTSTSTNDKVDIWANFLKRRKQYGNEAALLAHPEERLRSLVRHLRDHVGRVQEAYHNTLSSIIHGDATPTNILIDGNNVSLIDWEFSHYNDPMAEFSTIYYDDIDYNNGKWRIHITDEERSALFSGYRTGGGVIDEDRIRLWMNIDKLGASLYLYWRLNLSGRESTAEQEHLYKRELEKLINSLQDQLAD